MKTRPRSLLAVLLLAAVPACGGSSGDAGAQPGPDATDEFRDSAQALVTVASGGTLTLSDGTTLTIPPGAVAQDTTLRFSGLLGQRPDDLGRYWEVSPSMQLAKPAVITAPASANPDGMTWAFDSSPSAEVIDKVDESTSWHEAKIVPSAPGTIAIETMHFTGFAVINSVHDSGYLVVDVPAQYLEPGDILVTLSGEHPVGAHAGEPNWFPGHVGVFVGANDDGFKATDGIVGPDGAPVSGRPDIVESVKAGVKDGSVDKFRTGFDSDHLYLGPRRVGGLTNGDKQKIVDRVMGTRGQGYNLVGDASDFLATMVGGVTLNKIQTLKLGGKSCVGLADDALASVGKSPVSAVDRHIVAVTPLDMYHATKPVDSITVASGDHVTIPIYGVVVDPHSKVDALHTWSGYYTKQRATSYGAAQSKYDIEVTGLPQGATITPSDTGYVFDWPSAVYDGDAPAPVKLHIKMTYKSQATPLLTTSAPVDFPGQPIEQDLTIQVRPFRVGPIEAVFDPGHFATVYSVHVDNPTGKFANVTWEGPGCGTWDPQGLQPDSTDASIHWTMTWSHPHPPCDPTTNHSDTTIKATVHSYWGSAVCKYYGAESGVGTYCRY